jgi:hypothetical protein
MIYLNIHYSDRKKAKNLGALWCSKNKKWYCDDDNKEILEIFKEYKEIEIVGEDRNFGSNELYVDLIPKTTYYKNVRSIFTKEDWNIIRHHIYKRVNYKCECCGCYRNKYLEAHERWSYNEETKIQKLERIIALCKLCHKSVHYGHSKKDIIKINEHLKKIKKINDEELKIHIKEAKELRNKRNKINWELDCSIISNSGFEIKK